MPKPEHAPIVFKSKVVSRTHARLTVRNGKWYVQDVKSSSGTFLNRQRLSSAGIESEERELNDGDTLQLGMDFRGGSEAIYKCIKVRVELNNSWRKKANHYKYATTCPFCYYYVLFLYGSRLLTLFDSLNALEKLRNVSSLDPKEVQDCAVCLSTISVSIRQAFYNLGIIAIILYTCFFSSLLTKAIQPCQALFVAPCSHTWHYKCVRPIIVSSYPSFLCPNCRATWYLEDDPETPDLSHLTDAKAESVAESQ